MEEYSGYMGNMVEVRMEIIMAGGLTFFAPAVKHLGENGYLPIKVVPHNEKIELHKDWDLLICIGHPQIIKEPIFSQCRLGVINVHNTLLPKYRGRHGFVWSMIDGAEVGVTVHYMDAGIDTGDIILQAPMYVERGETSESVLQRMIPLTNDLLLASVKQIEAGAVYRRKQIEQLATYLPKRKPEDSMIHWEWSAENIVKFINALSEPYNAFTMIEGKRITFTKAKRGEGEEIIV